jgi:hypothetical protein
VVDSADNIKDTLDQMEKSRFFDTIDKAVESFDPFTFNPSRGSSPTTDVAPRAKDPGVVEGEAVFGGATGSIKTDEATIKDRLLELLKQFNATKAEWVGRPAQTKGRVLWELVLR